MRRVREERRGASDANDNVRCLCDDGEQRRPPPHAGRRGRRVALRFLCFFCLEGICNLAASLFSFSLPLHFPLCDSAALTLPDSCVPRRPPPRPPPCSSAGFTAPTVPASAPTRNLSCVSNSSPGLLPHAESSPGRRFKITNFGSPDAKIIFVPSQRPSLAPVCSFTSSTRLSSQRNDLSVSWTKNPLRQNRSRSCRARSFAAHRGQTPAGVCVGLLERSAPFPPSTLRSTASQPFFLSVQSLSPGCVSPDKSCSTLSSPVSLRRSSSLALSSRAQCSSRRAKSDSAVGRDAYAAARFPLAGRLPGSSSRILSTGTTALDCSRPCLEPTPPLSSRFSSCGSVLCFRSPLPAEVAFAPGSSSHSASCLSATPASLPSTFVSAYSTLHNAASLSAYLVRKRLEYVEHPNKFTLKFCPNCPDHKHRRDNLFKLEVFKNSGNCYCHRCGWKGSFFDLKTKLGDLNPQDVLAALHAAGDSPPGVAYAPGPWGALPLDGLPGPGVPTQAGSPGFAGGVAFASGGRAPGGFAGPLGGGGSLQGALAPAARNAQPDGGDRYVPRFEAFAEQLAEAAEAARRENEGNSKSAKDKKKTRLKKAIDQGESARREATATADERAGCGRRVLQYLTEKRGITLDTLRAYGVGCGSFYFPPAVDAGANGPPPKWESHDCVTFPWHAASDDAASSQQLPAAEVAAAFDSQPACGSPVAAKTRLLRARRVASGAFDAEGSGASGESGGSDAEKTKCAPAPTVPVVRVKVRSITEKSCMRLLPAGGQWGLFGAGIVPAEADTVVVTEGEFDAMSVYQQTGLPAVSVPMGAHSLPVQVLPFFERFKNIILWMDEDAAGREGAELFASKLGIGRCYLVRGSVVFDSLVQAAASASAAGHLTETPREKKSEKKKKKGGDEVQHDDADGSKRVGEAEPPRVTGQGCSGEAATDRLQQLAGGPDLRGGVPKDANEALLRGFDLRLFIDSAAPIPHSQILTFRDLRNSVFDEIMNPGRVRGIPSVTLPAFTRLLGGFRRGELSVWTGGTGMGKTTILSQLSIDFCLQGVPTLWGSFEVNNVRLLKTMLRQFSGGELDGDRARFDFFADKFAALPLYFLKFHGSTHVDEVIDAMDYACYVLDVGHVILDNLQFMLSGQGRGHEVWDMQNSAIEKFRRFATTKNVHISIVVHPRKEDDGTPLGISSVFGSVKSTQEADNVVILQRRRRSASAQAASVSSRTGARRGSMTPVEASAAPHPGDASQTENFLELRKNRFSGELGSVPYVFNKNSLTIRELSPSFLAADEETARRLSRGSSGSEAGSRRKRSTPEPVPPYQYASGEPSPGPTEDASLRQLRHDSQQPIMAHAFDRLQRRRDSELEQETGPDLGGALSPSGLRNGGFSGGSSFAQRAGVRAAFQAAPPAHAPGAAKPSSGLLQNSPSTTGGIVPSSSSIAGSPPAHVLHAAPASAPSPQPPAPRRPPRKARASSLSAGGVEAELPPSTAALDAGAAMQGDSASPRALAASGDDAGQSRHDASSASRAEATTAPAVAAGAGRSQPVSVSFSSDSPMPLLRELAHALPLTEPIKMSGPNRTKTAVYEDLRRVVERHPAMKRIAAAIVADFEKKQKKRDQERNSQRGKAKGTGKAADRQAGKEGDGDTSGQDAVSGRPGAEQKRDSTEGAVTPSAGQGVGVPYHEYSDATSVLLGQVREADEEDVEPPVVKLVPLQDVLGPVPYCEDQGETEEGGKEADSDARAEGDAAERHEHDATCQLQVAQPIEPPTDYIRSDFILVDSECKMRQLAPYLYRILEKLHPDDAMYARKRAAVQPRSSTQNATPETQAKGRDGGAGKVGRNAPATATSSGPGCGVAAGEKTETNSVCFSMGVDVETTGLDPYSARLRLLQLAMPDFPTLLFDLFSLPIDSPSLRAVRLLLASPRIRKVFHNGKFDLGFLAATGLAQSQDRREPTAPARTQERGSLEKASSRSPAAGDVGPGRSAGAEISEAGAVGNMQSSSKTGAQERRDSSMHLIDAAVLGDRPPEIGELQRDGGVFVEGPLFDTLIAAKVVEAGVFGTGYKLLQVVERFLGVLMDKRMQASDWSSKRLSQEQLLYAARDAAVMLPLQQRLQQKLEAHGLQEVMDVEMRCLRPVVAMELNGMQIDHAQWKDLEAHLREEEVKAKKRLAAELHVDENTVKFNSQKQMLDALRALGIPAPPPDSPSSPRGRGPRRPGYPGQGVVGPEGGGGFEDDGLLKDTSDGTLARLTHYPAVQALRDYRKAAKAITTFVDKLPQHINPVTGKIHCSLHQCGAGSGRFSCDSPNLQQIPRERRFRACFVPSKTVAGRPGKFIIADFSQIELRIAADLACDERMIEAYRKGEDLHKLTASLILNKPPSALSKADRQLAKAVNFGLIYGMSADRFKGYAHTAYGVQMTTQQARDFHAKYFSSYPGITRWHQRQKAEQPRETRTRAGRRALFDYFAFTKSLNYPVQGTSADITKESLVRLQSKLAPLGGRLVMCVHDEIIAEVPEDKAEEGLRILIATMEAAGNKYLRFVPCVAEGAVADSWADKP